MSEARKPPVFVMLAFGPEEMARRGRIRASVAHARHGAQELTAPAHTAFLATTKKQIDPDGVLPPDERRRRATHASKAYMARLARLSVLARRGACDAVA